MVSTSSTTTCALFFNGEYLTNEHMNDNRFLVKPTKSAIELMPNATYELPYEGAKEMLLVDNVDSKDFLAKLFNAM